ncbi:putative phospholipase D family protein [uncultured Rubrobacteraceae bacterium]|uniref:Putative phospholipase D family protein n=1 Tax=uncultured Rubrobacteraceae bacterium TaxID=349277 RepID=A0A6J4Q3Z3_9ACTN|nr:putative phospholipase D family protein [uncultured Rubrobacteraceae bacterium]
MDASGHNPPTSAPPTLAPSGGRLDAAIERHSAAPLREGNRLALLLNGPDTYDDWLAAIGRAEGWVHLDNYIFRDDAVGRRFADALKEKAAEGVAVRVLHDWFGCLDVPRSFWRELRGAGVQVRAVNPPTLGAPLRAIRRDHRKLVAVDGEYASTGGVCIGEGWMVRSPETGLPYRDTAVSVRGPAVGDLERAFADLWAECGGPLPDEERTGPGRVARAGDVAARVIVQEPRRMRVLRVLALLTAGVRERLWVTDAYFLSMPILTQSLMATARDGVDVRVLVPATNDLPWIGALSRSGYRQFLEAGVRVFEYGGPMIHAKTLVADGWWAKVGSTNLNFSSLAANWEIDLVAEDFSFASEMERVFEEDLANAREVRLVRTARGQEVRAGRPMNTADRGARRNPVGSGTGSTATATRVGGAALWQGSTLRNHGRALAAAAGGALVGASVLGVRFPRLVAWPLSAVGGAVGGLSILHAVRRKSSE